MTLDHIPVSLNLSARPKRLPVSSDPPKTGDTLVAAERTRPRVLRFNTGEMLPPSLPSTSTHRDYDPRTAYLVVPGLNTATLAARIFGAGQPQATSIPAAVCAERATQPAPKRTSG